MSDTSIYKEQFRALKCCVLIPTFNNAQKLEEVVQSVLAYSDDVCVVNDGSTDNTLEILARYPALHIHSYTKNRGKGWALRQGFEFARSKGYAFAISIDSDGQHYASDLPKFLEQLQSTKDAIIIGSRNMGGTANVPGKSSFGNQFSNFWFRLETGVDAPDTQSGYRLYPLLLLQPLRFFTRKYEFEIEVLVRAAWRGVRILALPIAVYYPPREERITHFRPFKDFSRISVLNTVLVLVTFFWIKPRNLFRSLFR